MALAINLILVGTKTIVKQQTFYSNRVLRYKELFKQFNFNTDDLSLSIHKKVEDLTDKEIIPFGHIEASHQETNDRNHYCDVTSDVKREIHHADDIKRNVPFFFLYLYIGTGDPIPWMNR